MTRVLIVNACKNLEGDFATVITLLREADRSRVQFVVASQPDGETHRAIAAIPDVTLAPIDMGGEYQRADSPAARLIAKLRAGVHSAAALPRLVLIGRRHRVNVVYAIDRGIAPKLGVVVARLLRRPFVLCAAYPFYANNGRSCRTVLASAARVHGHSRYLQQHLEPHLRAAEAYELIPNGVPVGDLPAAADVAAARRHHDVEPDEPLVVMTGRLNQFKGQDDLIRAAAIVTRSRPDVQFRIAGRGDHEPVLRDLIDDLGVGGNVRLVGYVDDVHTFLAAGDIVTMPSHEEPFGLVALEGMAVGKPVVATDAGGVPEFVTDGAVGLLVPPRSPAALADSLLTLLNDSRRRTEMGAAARAHVINRFTAAHYVDRVTNVLTAAAAR